MYISLYRLKWPRERIQLCHFSSLHISKFSQGHVSGILILVIAVYILVSVSGNWNRFGLMIKKRQISIMFLLNFFFFRLLTESKQEEFIERAKMLIRLQKYVDAVSILKMAKRRWDRSDLSHLLKWVLLSFVCHQVSLCQSLISHALEGLVYYHTYDRFFLGCSVVLGFVGWTSYVVLLILKTHASLIRNPSVLRQVRADKLT